MLIGAYTYAVLSIPAASRDTVYQYFNGGLIKFSIPEICSNALGGILGDFGYFLGEYIGMFIPLVLAGVFAAVFAFLIGIPVLRLKSDYLAIATLGFAEILRAFFQWNTLGPITNGSNILRSFSTYETPLFPIIVSGLCIAFIVLLINSSYGRAFKAIRDDEIAAEAMGVNLFKHKQWSFIISSFFAGIGGALLAMFQSSITSTPFTSNLTYELLLIVVIGGIGSVTGSVVGAFLFVACSEWWLRFLDSGSFMGMSVEFMRPGFRKVVFAIIIMLIVLFYRRGIMGTKEFSWDSFLNFFRNLPSKIKNLFKKHKNNTDEAKEAQ
jgi:branched-chain amino acid transport system permease protein